MGLDMYLTGRRYVSVYDNAGNELYGVISPLLAEAKGKKVTGVSVEFMYWRKANAIHNWFVKNVQDGEDDCKEYSVTRDQLIALRDTCRAVLDNPEKAPELLPTVGGFFFGSTEYDSYYFDDVKETFNELNEMFKDDPDGDKFAWWDFFYQSSW